MQEMKEMLDLKDPLEEGIATHSSILAWRVPRTQEPGGLQSIGSQRVGQDWSDSAPDIISLLTPKGANATPTQILLLMWITLFNRWLLKKVKLPSPQTGNAKQLYVLIHWRPSFTFSPILQLML